MSLGIYCIKEFDSYEDGVATGAYIETLSSFLDGHALHECHTLLCGHLADEKLHHQYDCLFLRLPQSIRATLLRSVSETYEKASLGAVIESELPNKYIKIADRVKESLERVIPDVEATVSLTHDDFCILIPHGLLSDLNGLRPKMITLLYSICPDALDADPTQDRSIAETVDAIWKRFDDQYIYRRNPNYREYATAIRRLLEIRCESGDKRYECALMALLLLRTVLDETSLRWVYDSGDLHYEDPYDMEEIDLSTRNLLGSLGCFIDQASDECDYSDILWMTVFITRALLAAIMGRSEEESIKKERTRLTQRNFYGFLPFVTSNYKEVTSYYAKYHTPDYCYGFLAIPQKYKNSFWEMFPAYIHEFFHYIPTPHRKDRNEAILSLALIGVLNPLYSALCGDMSARGKHAYASMLENILRHILSKRKRMMDDVLVDYNFNTLYKGCEWNTKIDEIFETDTTMKFSDLMASLFPMLDFGTMYDNALIITDDLDTNTIRMISEAKEECVDLWTKEAVAYITIFSTALKEIRSDILMCRIIGLSLQEYITIMANEPNFAYLSRDSVADSTMIRFGFMCRYLYAAGKNDGTAGDTHSSRSKKSVSEWMKTCKAVIDNVPHIDANIKANLSDYLDEYCAITIDEDTAGDDAIILFEDILCGVDKTSDAVVLYTGDNGLIGEWEKQIDEISGYQIFACLKSLYMKYKDLDRLEDKVMFEYRTRLVLRDLFEVFPNIDLDTASEAFLR